MAQKGGRLVGRPLERGPDALRPSARITLPSASEGGGFSPICYSVGAGAAGEVALSPAAASSRAGASGVLRLRARKRPEFTLMRVGGDVLLQLVGFRVYVVLRTLRGAGARGLMERRRGCCGGSAADFAFDVKGGSRVRQQVCGFPAPLESGPLKESTPSKGVALAFGAAATAQPRGCSSHRRSPMS
jgi:hypothetical protein